MQAIFESTTQTHNRSNSSAIEMQAALDRQPEAIRKIVQSLTGVSEIPSPQ
jgi:hypothetical protein